MADQQTNLELPTGDELFGSLHDEATITQDAPEIETAEQETTQGQPRDENGKFAAKPKEDEAKTDPEPKPVQATQPDKADAMVPSWRLREQREEFEARIANLQKQFSENKPRPEPVDFFADPDKSIDQRLAPIQSQFQDLQTTLLTQSSKALNIAIHGKEVVTAAEDAARQAIQERDPEIPELEQRMTRSSDPVGALIDWHNKRQFMKETGGDLKGYQAKLEEKLLADPAFIAKAVERFKAQATGRPPSQTQVQIPRSLSNAAAAAPANSRGGDGDDSPESIWAHATN